MSGATIPEWDLTDRLRKSLRHADIDPAEMADFLEVHRNTVTNWLQGRTKPRPSDVKQWSVRAGVPYEWLAHGITPGSLPHQDSRHRPAGIRREGSTERVACSPSIGEILSFQKRIPLQSPVGL